MCPRGDPLADLSIGPAHDLAHPALGFPCPPLLVAYAHIASLLSPSILARVLACHGDGSLSTRFSRNTPWTRGQHRRRIPPPSPLALALFGYKLSYWKSRREREQCSRPRRTRSLSAGGSTRFLPAETSMRRTNSLPQTTPCTTLAFRTMCTAPRA